MIDLLRPPCWPGRAPPSPGEAGAERCCGPGQQSRAGRRTDRSTNYSDVIKHRSGARVKHPRHKMLWKTCLLGAIVPLYVVVAGTSRPREDQPCVAPSAGPTRTAWSTPGRPRTVGRSVAGVPARSAVGASPPSSGSRRRHCWSSSVTAPGSSSSSASSCRAWRRPARTGRSLARRSYASPVTSRRRSGPGPARGREPGGRHRAPQRPPGAGPGRLHALRQRLQGLPGPGRLRARAGGPRLLRKTTPRSPFQRQGAVGRPGGGAHDRGTVVELAARTLALGTGIDSSCPAWSPPWRSLASIRPSTTGRGPGPARPAARSTRGCPGLDHVGDPRRRPVGPVAPGQAGSDQQEPADDQHDGEHPDEQPAAPQTHPADLLVPLASHGVRPGERLFDHVLHPARTPVRCQPRPQYRTGVCFGPTSLLESGS